MRFRGIFSAAIFLALPTAAIGFNPRVNIADLAKVSWGPGEAKIAIRNDWIENHLTLELNETIRQSPDIKRGSGEVRVVAHDPTDSIVTLGFSFDVIPDRVWFDPHVRCRGRIRVSFPPMPLEGAEARVLDREPIERCEVSGAIGGGLDLGRFVRERLNERVARLPESNLLLRIGEALFGDPRLRERMSRMYLLQELAPLATLGMDDCDADANMGVSAGQAVCLRLRWPAPKFDEALAKLLRNPPEPRPTSELIPEVRIQNWRELAPVCVHQGVAYPSKVHCDTGDMTLFAGLLCLSGEELGCQMVRDAQDAGGRWWRSPQRLGRPDENFSPDMFLGTVAYLNRSRDGERLRRWTDYVLGQARLFPTQNSPRLTLHQSCPDGAEGVCNVMGSEWYWLGRMRAWMPVLGALPDYGYDSSWLVVEALTNERSFRLHLVGVAVLMQRMFGDPTDLNVALAARVLAAREPRNPFFVYLATGRDRRVLELIEEQCPAFGARPSWQNEWSWERKIEDRAYEDSMGWDCVFMANLWNQGLGPVQPFHDSWHPLVKGAEKRRASARAERR